MSHKSVRQLIRDTAKSLGDSVQFVYARKTDFNAIRDKKYPFIQLELLNSNASFTNNTLTSSYPVAMTFYELDSLTGSEDSTTNILDATDDLAQSFIRKMNIFSFDEDDTVSISTKNIMLSNVKFQSFVKMTTDCLTGWILTFDMEVPDDFDYCSLYDE
jgi:hypothetical protein